MRISDWSSDVCSSDLHIGPGGAGNEVEMGLAMLRGAKRAGVRHVVMSSIYHTMIDILQHRYKRDIEEKIVESGLNFTILKFHDYMMPEVYVKPVLQGDRKSTRLNSSH